MSPTPLVEELGRLQVLLERIGVPYALAGGLAMAAYGLPRATIDVDVLVGVAEDGLDRLRQAARKDGYIAGEADLLRMRNAVIQRLHRRGGEGTSLTALDLLLAGSLPFHGVLERCRTVRLEGRALPVVSPEDLVLMKISAGRPQDLADIEWLRTAVKLDETLLQREASRLAWKWPPS